MDPLLDPLSTNVESEDTLRRRFSKVYKYCIVPKCTSTTIMTPGKLFFQVPKDPTIRKNWCKVMRRDQLESSTTTRYCCEDHFELEHDMSNYWHHRLMKSAPRLKSGVLPHKFICQQRSQSQSPEPSPERIFICKKRGRELVDDAQEASTHSSRSHPQPSTSRLAWTPVEYDDIVKVKAVAPSCDKQTQVNIKPRYRSKSTNVHFALLTKRSRTVATSPIIFVKNELNVKEENSD